MTIFPQNAHKKSTGTSTQSIIINTNSTNHCYVSSFVQTNGINDSHINCDNEQLLENRYKSDFLTYIT